MIVCPRRPGSERNTRSQIWPLRRGSCARFSSSNDIAGLETQSSAEITNADLADPTQMPPADGLVRVWVLPERRFPGRALLLRRTRRRGVGSYLFAARGGFASEGSRLTKPSRRRRSGI